MVGMTAEGNVSMLLKDPRKVIRAIASLLLIALLVVQVNIIADRAWCSGLETDELSTISLYTPLYKVITGLVTGLGIGAVAVISRHIEAGDHDGSSGNALQVLLFGFIFGIALIPFMVFLCEDMLVLIGLGDII